MNIDYINGFFDADGSITISKQYKTSKYKALKIDFPNTELCILEEIKSYLLDLGIKSYLNTKPPKKDTHQTGYTLSLSGEYAFNLCKLLTPKHLKKLHRVNCVIKYWKDVTSRNGKYSSKQISRKLAFERLFLLNFR